MTESASTSSIVSALLGPSASEAPAAAPSPTPAAPPGQGMLAMREIADALPEVLQHEGIPVREHEGAEIREIARSLVGQVSVMGDLSRMIAQLLLGAQHSHRIEGVGDLRGYLQEQSRFRV